MAHTNKESSCLIDLDQTQTHTNDPVLNQSVIHHFRVSSSSPLEADVEMKHFLSPESLRRSSCNDISNNKTEPERLNRTERGTVWKYVTKEELISKSLVDLKKLWVDLSLVVEGVSSELVRLLEERQTLQDEVDIRNIAIEQLWKVQGKLQWRLTEPPLGIQMGVIFPSDSTETVDYCQ